VPDTDAAPVITHSLLFVLVRANQEIVSVGVYRRAFQSFEPAAVAFGSHVLKVGRILTRSREDAKKNKVI
jgi:hypothetical protein